MFPWQNNPNNEGYTILLDKETALKKPVLMEYLYSENKTKFIPYIYMEWIHIHNNLNGMCPDFKKLIQGFVKSGYKAKGKGPKGYVDVDPNGGLIDCIWVHKDAKPLIAK